LKAIYQNKLCSIFDFVWPQCQKFALISNAVIMFMFVHISCKVVTVKYSLNRDSTATMTSNRGRIFSSMMGIHTDSHTYKTSNIDQTTTKQTSTTVKAYNMSQKSPHRSCFTCFYNLRGHSRIMGSYVRIILYI